MYCPHCGTGLPDHARYCDACGRPLLGEGQETARPGRWVNTEDHSGSIRDSYHRFVAFVLENSAALVLGVVAIGVVGTVSALAVWGGINSQAMEMRLTATAEAQAMGAAATAVAVTATATYAPTAIQETRLATATSTPTATPASTPAAPSTLSLSTRAPMPTVPARKIEVYARGVGFPADWAQSAVQREQSALKAAELDAKRNLVEWINGVEVEAVTVLSQGQVEVEVVRQLAGGHLRGVVVVDQSYDDDVRVARVRVMIEVDPAALP